MNDYLQSIKGKITGNNSFPAELSSTISFLQHFMLIRSLKNETAYIDLSIVFAASPIPNIFRRDCRLQ